MKFLRVVLTMVILSTASAGCFDASTVSPGIVIDDFEDGDDLPSGPAGFYQWVFFTYNPNTQLVNHSVGERSPGQHVLDARFVLADPPDGVRQYGGGGLGLYAASKFGADLSSYTEMRVSALLERDDSPTPDIAVVTISLRCSTVPNPDGGEPTPAIEQRLPGIIKSGWTMLRLPLAGFQQSTSPGVSFFRDCLTRIDGITFNVTPSLEDGQTATLTLHLDDIQFVDAHDR